MLPAANDIADVEAMLNTLGKSDAPNGPGRVVLEVFFDSVGSLDRARVLYSDLDGELTESLLSNVRRSTVHAAGDRGWGVLVQAAGSRGTGEVTVGRMEYCRCALINRGEVARAAERLVRGGTVVGVHGRREILLDVRSDTTGAILEKKLYKSSGSIPLDMAIIELAETMEVAPPLLNRRPTNGWSRLPLLLTFPSSPVSR